MRRLAGSFRYRLAAAAGSAERHGGNKVGLARFGLTMAAATWALWNEGVCFPQRGRGWGTRPGDFGEQTGPDAAGHAVDGSTHGSWSRVRWTHTARRVDVVTTQ